jgi:hypothetical protein
MARSDDFTFGIEIETHMPMGSVDVGSHGCGRQVEWLPTGWLADRDPSIAAPSGRLKCEFVSPVLRGVEGLRQALDAVREIKERGGKINPSCGLHIHVGFDKRDTAALGRLINLVAAHEGGLFAITGSKSREQGTGSASIYSTHWCKSIKQYGSVRGFAIRSRDRYHCLNVATDKPTVEFRVFGSTLNVTKIAAYVRVCVGLCQKALDSKRNACFTSKSKGPLTRIGRQGQAEMNRMFQSLRWNRPDRMLGDIVADDLPSMQSTRKELRRLSMKYDGVTE